MRNHLCKYDVPTRPKLLIKTRSSDLESQIRSKIQKLIKSVPMSQIGDVLGLNVKLTEAKGNPLLLVQLNKEVDNFLNN